MKYLLLVVSFLVITVVSAQSGSDTTISKWKLDSLRAVLWNRAETINRMHWAYQRKVYVVKTDSLFVRPDSLVISQWTKDQKLVYQESVSLRKVSFKTSYCKGLIVMRFFDQQERPVYIEYWDGRCYDETNKEEDVNFFESMRRKQERIVYNNAGLKIRRVTTELLSGRWFTYQFTYQFENGKEIENVSKIEYYNFWD